MLWRTYLASLPLRVVLLGITAKFHNDKIVIISVDPRNGLPTHDSGRCGGVSAVEGFEKEEVWVGGGQRVDEEGGGRGRVVVVEQVQRQG